MARKGFAMRSTNSPWLVLALDPIKGAKADVVGNAENVTRWVETMGAREAVKKGMIVPEIPN